MRLVSLALGLSLSSVHLAAAQDTDYTAAAEPDAPQTTIVDEDKDRSFTAEEMADIRRRLRDMDCIIDKRDHPVVEAYLKGYLLRNRAKSERILGRVPAYFPMFERELAEAGLPDDLKYLAIVESALVTRALSHAGAGGLWQFMPGTGTDFGLRIDNSVDQRGDPLLATRAAIAFLRDEYSRFGDWALVLAAYNGGPGRVRRIVKSTGRADFWAIHKHLPRETRNYVPAFVAAMYLHKYAHLHGLQPVAPSLDEQLVETVICPQGINLREVAQATDLPLELVQELNVHCLKGYLPAGPQANCRVPARTAADLQAYVDLKQQDPNHPFLSEIRSRPIVSATDANYDHLYLDYELDVDGGQSLRQIARDNDLSAHHLSLWNPGIAPSSYLSEGRTLRVYSYAGESTFLAASRRQRDIAPLATAPLPPLAQGAQYFPSAIDQRAPNREIVVRRYESLLDIWQRYANSMTWQEFVRWNAIDGNSHVQAGDRVLIRA